MQKSYLPGLDRAEISDAITIEYIIASIIKYKLDLIFYAGDM